MSFPLIPPETFLPHYRVRFSHSLLKNDLNFNGLTFRCNEYGRCTKYATQGEAEVIALKAGMDVLEYVTNPELAIKPIIKRIKNGELSQAAINEKCRKVLAAKYWAGLYRTDSINEIMLKKICLRQIRR